MKTGYFAPRQGRLILCTVLTRLHDLLIQFVNVGRCLEAGCVNTLELCRRRAIVLHIELPELHLVSQFGMNTRQSRSQPLRTSGKNFGTFATETTTS